MDLGELRKMFMAGSLQVWMPSFKGLSQQQRSRINPTYKNVLFQKSGQETIYCGDPGCVYMHTGLATLISLV